jgi:hypothetical protein
MADDLATFMCRMSRNSGGINLLEHEGPVQASKRIALTLPLRRKTESQRCKLCIERGEFNFEILL